MRFSAVAVIGACLVAQSVVQAAEISFYPNGLVRLHATVESLYDRRWSNIVRQGIDISCGSAALATILQYQFGDEVQESALIQTILRDVKPDAVRKRGGFSLLDLKRAAVNFGYSAQGYKLPLDVLSGMGTPAIVVLSVRGRKHFVVFRGMVGNRVVLADPAFGNILVKEEEFQVFWSGIALVIRREGKDQPGSLLAIQENDLEMTQAIEAVHSFNRGPVVYTVVGPNAF